MLVVGVEVMDSDIQTAAENYFLSSNFSNRRVLEDIIHVRYSLGGKGGGAGSKWFNAL